MVSVELVQLQQYNCLESIDSFACLDCFPAAAIWHASHCTSLSSVSTFVPLQSLPPKDLLISVPCDPIQKVGIPLPCRLASLLHGHGHFHISSAVPPPPHTPVAARMYAIVHPLTISQNIFVHDFEFVPTFSWVFSAQPFSIPFHKSPVPQGMLHVLFLSTYPRWEFWNAAWKIEKELVSLLRLHHHHHNHDEVAHDPSL
mmetsp:Transcript_9690/g.18193  ORF Transcript_9690/g.18193 Transcript_9690/m.18193 type:complete len:200 (+) Transcript_9690:965-1564(+)